MDDELDPGDHRLVDAPPISHGGKGSIPTSRLQAIDFAKQHPKRWIEYKPDPEVDRVKLATLFNAAYRGYGCGLDGGNWNASIRGKSIFLRYLGPKAAK